MGWYEFASEESFNIWHEAIKTQLGLPKLSVDQNGLECEPLIENYTQLVSNEDRLIAFSDPEYSEGLTDTHPPVPKLNFS
jgi:hypothetical protein